MMDKTGLMEPRYYLRYLHGDACFDASSRKVTVRALCGQTNAIVDFIENGKCQYEMTLTTPAACNSKYYIDWKKRINQIEAETIGKSNTKDEL